MKTGARGVSACVFIQAMLSASSDNRTETSKQRNLEHLGLDHGSTRLELGSNEAIKQAILAGLGISALSRHALTLNAPDQFAVLDVEGFPILRHWYTVYPAGRQLSVVAAGVSGLFAEAGGGGACGGGQEEKMNWSEYST